MLCFYAIYISREATYEIKEIIRIYLNENYIIHAQWEQESWM
jgi:hypothetical protein